MTQHPGCRGRAGGGKLGVGDRERIGNEVAIGHLTSATLLAPAATYHAVGDADLHADAEVAFQVGRDVDAEDAAGARAAIVGVGVALELVGLTRPPEDPVSVVAANVFHRAVAFGPFQPARPAAGAQGRLLVNGRVVTSGSVANDVEDRVGAVARPLGAMGERPGAGDQLITGAVVQVALNVGDQVVADLGLLGRVGLGSHPCAGCGAGYGAGGSAGS